jgi:hypothetical protein
VDTRTRDIRHRRGDDEVRGCGLELPADLSHPAGVDGVGTREDDGVGARLVEHPAEARVVAEHRDAGCQFLLADAALGDGTDDHDPGGAVSCDLIGDVHRLPSLAHQDRAMRERP